MATETFESTSPATGEVIGTFPSSGAEDVKEQSRQLRGTILDELQKDTPQFGEADKNLLKFHGTYQQDDRDGKR